MSQREGTFDIHSLEMEASLPSLSLFKKRNRKKYEERRKEQW